MARLRSLKAKKEELIQTLDKSYTFWNCLKESVDESDRALLIMTAEISELTDIKNQVSKIFLGGDCIIVVMFGQN